MRLLPWVVLAAALVGAVHLYGAFLEHSHHLWFSSTHDRNAHYLFALKLATDVRQGHVLRLLTDFNQACVWPPLHGLLAAAALLVGGLDFRVAVVPSLLGWVGAVVLAFLVGRRAAPHGGNLAGLAAALLLAASPSHRAFATDVMLESLGACLTLAVLYFYLALVQEAGPGAGRRLGLALTVLFLLKYNYWVLAVLALLAAEVTARPGVVRVPLSALAAIEWRSWCRAQLRRPLNYPLVLLLALCMAVLVRGDRPLALFGHRLSAYPPHNLVTAAYAVFFLRLAAWWRTTGRGWVAGLDPRLGQLICWHLAPVAWWFLLPKHLSSFLWYVSPADANPTDHVDFLRGVRHYVAPLLHDYHLGAGHTLLVVFLAGAGLLAWQRSRRGQGAVVAWLLFLAAGLTILHPNHKERFLHTWVAALWVMAGVGLTSLVQALTEQRRRLRPWVAATALAGLAGLCLPGLAQQGRAVEGGIHPERPCLLDLTEYIRPDVDSARRLTVLSGVPVKPLVQWTFLERRGCFDGLEEHWYGFGPPGAANREGFRSWLRTTDCDTLILLEDLKPPGPSLYEAIPECRLHEELLDLLGGPTPFRPVKQRVFPRHACRITVWRRAE